MADRSESDAGGKKARFEDLLEFPTLFKFRVVCASLPRVAEQACACLERLTGESAAVVGSQPSRNGTWTVHRIEVQVRSADEIRSAYDALAKVDGVRMVL